MYVELHARSAFSFLEGASLPEELAALCAHLHMPAMALLDTDGVYGAPRFYMAAKKIGLTAHMGAEITCQPFGSVILSRAGTSRSEALAESTDPYPRQAVQRIGVPPLRLRSGLTFRLGRTARNDKSCRLPLLVSCREGYQ